MPPLLPLQNLNSIPSIGLGTYRLLGEEAISVIQTALDLGYRHIDTADYYFNHDAIGKAISSWDREQLFITSKLTLGDLDRKSAIRACERFLKELNTDYLDLLLIHWPSADTPLEETFDGFAELIEKGLIRNAGVSNFTIPLLERCVNLAAPVAVNQVEFHPYFNQKELYTFCTKHKIALEAYRPLGKGVLSDNDTLNEIAKTHNASALQVSLAWLLSKNIISIPKSSSPKHLEENISSYRINLDPDDIDKIEGLNKNLRQVAAPSAAYPHLFKAILNN